MSENHEEIIKRLEFLEEEMKLLKSQHAELLAEKVIVDKSREVVEPKPEREKRFVDPEFTHPDEKVYAMKNTQTSVVKKEFDFEKVMGLWLPRVFMFILLLGVLWGLKLGMNHGFITNPVRVGLGYAGTALLYYLGMKYYKGKNRVFGLTLLGGLITLGILTTFAAHHLYGYFNFTTAFVIGVAYIVMGVLLSEKTKSETLTIFSAIGGFLLPFLLEGEGATSIQFCAYILILFLSLFYVSLRQKQKYTFYITFFLFHLTLVAYSILNIGSGDEPILVGTVLIQHLLLLVFYLRGTISRHVFSEALIYSNFVFALGWIKLLEADQEIVVYGFLAFVYVTKAIYFFVKKDALLGGVLSAVAVFALSAFVLSFSFTDDNITLLLLLVNGTVGLWVGLRFNTIRTIVTSSIIYVLAAYIVFFTINLTGFYSVEHALWLTFLFTVILIYYSLYKLSPSFLKGKLKEVNQSLIIGQLIVLNYVVRLTGLGLQDTRFGEATIMHVYGLVLIITLSGMYFLHKWGKGQYVTHAVVIEFLLLGVFILFLGLSNRLNDPNFLFNIAVEIVYVIVLTTMFIAVMKERFYDKTAKLKEKLPMLALIMQGTFFVFVNKWYISTALFYELDMEYLLLIHTFLLFTFSFISISIGGKLNWRHVKLAGAWLIVICILKLFFVDLGSVSIFVRAILFIIVGIVGLVYSKTLFKES